MTQKHAIQSFVFLLLAVRLLLSLAYSIAIRSARRPMKPII